MEVSLADPDLAHTPDIHIVAAFMCNFLTSGCSRKIAMDFYYEGNNTPRYRYLFHHYDAEIVIILEVYTPGKIPMSPPDDRISVSLDRYQLHKTEKVYPFVSFTVKGIREMSSREFFDQLIVILRDAERLLYPKKPCT